MRPRNLLGAALTSRTRSMPTQNSSMLRVEAPSRMSTNFLGRRVAESVSVIQFALNTIPNRLHSIHGVQRCLFLPRGSPSRHRELLVTACRI